jgi:N-carbamoylputrescine amidase
VVAVNRTGFEPTPDEAASQHGIEFWGQSFVAASDGAVLYRAPVAEEAIGVVPLDLAKLEELRVPAILRDRRIDAYGEMTQRFIDRA